MLHLITGLGEERNESLVLFLWGAFTLVPLGGLKMRGQS